MRRIELAQAAGALAYGSVLINTMPVWLVALTEKSGGDDTLPGILASVVLMATAGSCGLGGGFLRRPVLWAAALIVLALPVLGAGAPHVGPPVLLSAGALYGAAFGLILRRALIVLMATGDAARVIGNTLAFGVIASLAVLGFVTAFPALILLVLAAFGLIPALTGLSRGCRMTVGTVGITFQKPGWRSAGFLAFFTAMGSYWAFLEIYADHQGVDPVSGWLFAGLVASAVGSGLAARVARDLRQRILPLAMLAATACGAVTYATVTPWIIGASIIANGFFLFVFFPLYLQGGTSAEAAQRMALYLAGFALGGVVGAMVIAVGGFSALALAILLSGAVALPAAATAYRTPVT